MSFRIKEVRDSLGITQEEFASKISITRGALSRLESGERNPSDQTIQLICNQFHVNPAYIRGGSDDVEMFLTAEDDEELVDQVMTGSNEWAKKLIISIVKAGEDGNGWEILKQAYEALKKAGL